MLCKICRRRVFEAGVGEEVCMREAARPESRDLSSRIYPFGRHLERNCTYVV